MKKLIIDIKKIIAELETTAKISYDFSKTNLYKDIIDWSENPEDDFDLVNRLSNLYSLTNKFRKTLDINLDADKYYDIIDDMLYIYEDLDELLNTMGLPDTFDFKKKGIRGKKDLERLNSNFNDLVQHLNEHDDQSIGKYIENKYLSKVNKV